MQNLSSLQHVSIIVTRPKQRNQTLKMQLEQLGANVYEFPSIRIVPNDENTEVLAALASLEQFQWIIFTSVEGVNAFFRVLAGRGFTFPSPNQLKIAAVGDATANAVRSFHHTVNFIPSQFLTSFIAREIGDVSNQKILLPRANIVSHDLQIALKEKGAIVTNIAMYKTEYVNERDEHFEELIEANTFHYVTFTSSSTVNGCLTRLPTEELRNKLRSIPVLSIGPITSKTCELNHFTTIYTADSYSIPGMIKKLLTISL